MWDSADDERKVVTVLFADLVGSTELSGQLDPEILRSLLVRYFELLAACIERHGGTVEKFIGDAVMAVFGVPVTHEDDARRALAAAIEIIGAMTEFSAGLRERHGTELAVRIGVTTGEVIATRDAARRQVLVSGEIVNLAARLQQHAGAGEILIGAGTQQAAGPAAVTSAARPLLVKGKAETIEAYPLRGLMPDDPAATRRFDAPFTGRARELAALDRAAQWAASGSAANLVMLYGDPGIGKTRLLAEWLARLASGPAIATARCPGYAQDASLRPLLDLAGQLAGLAGDYPEARDALLAQLAAAAAGDLQMADLYACLADLAAALAGSRLVLLLVDDVQWASSLLLETIGRLCEDLGRAPLLCVCAARPDFADGGPRLGRDLLNFTAMQLGPMTDEEAAAFAAALRDEVVAHDAGVAARLLELAEGNPFHLEQLAAAQQDGHDLTRIPPTVRALVAARLDVLEPGERGLLELAAVAGRAFTVADLETLPGEDTGRAGQLLRALARRRLLAEHRPGGGSLTYRFASTLIHDVAYEAMTKARRAALHERAGSAAAARAGTAADAGGRRSGHARAGRHLEAACRYRAELGDPEPVLAGLRRQAVGHLVTAGSAALREVDLAWAADLLGRAAGLVRPADPDGGTALELYGEALHASGARDRALTVLRAARQHALAQGQAAVAARARLLIAQLEPAPESVAAVARAAAGTFAAEGDRLGLARTHLIAGAGLQSRGRFEESVTVLEAALRHAASAGAGIEQANALGAIGQALWLGPAPAATAIARCRALLAEHGADRRALQATAGFPLTLLLAASGDPAAAAGQLAVTGRAMTDLRHGEAPVFRPLLHGLVALLAGDATRAITELRRAHDAATSLGSGYLTRLAAAELARALLTAGRPGEADPLIRAASAGAAAAGAATGGGAVAERAGLAGLGAWCAGLRGDGDGAASQAREAIAAARRTDSPVVLATACLDHARARHGHGADPRQAAAAARDAYRSKGHAAGAAAAALLAGQPPPP